MPKPFIVPTLAEADADYGSLSERYTALSNELAEISREADDLEADIRARRAPSIRPGVAELIGEAVELTRSGEGPVLLRLTVPRLSGHSGQDTQTYKSPEEVAAEKARDPLHRLREQIVPAQMSEQS